MVTKLEIKKASEVEMVMILDKLGIPYTRVGRTVKTTCPFHEEYKGSAVYYDHHMHCYGCGAHHNTISLIQHLLKVNFPTAVKALLTIK